MSKLPEIIDTVDHITVQLEKAHSVLDEVCAYFVSENDRSYLPIAAAHINDLLHVVDDYILDATGAARSAVTKANKVFEAENLSETEDSEEARDARDMGAADAEDEFAED